MEKIEPKSDRVFQAIWDILLINKLDALFVDKFGADRIEKDLTIHNAHDKHVNMIDVGSSFGRIQLLRKFKADGVDLNKSCVHCNGTPLMLAATAGKLEPIQYLVEEAKVDLFAKNSSGKDAYDIAMYFNQDEIVEYLKNEMNKRLTFDSRRDIILLRDKKQPLISKIPDGLFKRLVEYM